MCEKEKTKQLLGRAQKLGTRTISVTSSSKAIGGEGGIRTHDALSGTPHFECGTFNHSATSPKVERTPREVRVSGQGGVISGERDFSQGSSTLRIEDHLGAAEQGDGLAALAVGDDRVPHLGHAPAVHEVCLHIHDPVPRGAKEV